jgi:hypothetical protein
MKVSEDSHQIRSQIKTKVAGLRILLLKVVKISILAAAMAVEYKTTFKGLAIAKLQLIAATEHEKNHRSTTVM